MGNKQKSKSTQTNTYGHITPPKTPAVTNMENMRAKIDSSIPFRYAKQREQLENTFHNPLGSFTSPAVREAVGRSAGQRLNMEEAQAVQNSELAAENENFSRQAQIAAMTRPQMVNTGGTGTQTQSNGWINNAAGIVALS